LGVTVKRPVLVKVVVTEHYRSSRIGEMRTALARLDVVGKQLVARLESNPESELSERLKIEQKRNESARAALRRELEKISGLAIGSEYELATLEGNVELNIGDDFLNLGPCEVVVKDSKIIEIRDGLCPEVSETSS
jgi:hypothetical protein